MEVGGTAPADVNGTRSASTTDSESEPEPADYTEEPTTITHDERDDQNVPQPPQWVRYLRILLVLHAPVGAEDLCNPIKMHCNAVYGSLGIEAVLAHVGAAASLVLSADGSLVVQVVHLLLYRPSVPTDMEWLKTQEADMKNQMVVMCAAIFEPRKLGHVTVRQAVAFAAARGWRYCETDGLSRTSADLLASIKSLAVAANPGVPVYQPYDASALGPSTAATDVAEGFGGAKSYGGRAVPKGLGFRLSSAQPQKDGSAQALEDSDDGQDYGCEDRHYVDDDDDDDEGGEDLDDGGPIVLQSLPMERHAGGGVAVDLTVQALHGAHVEKLPKKFSTKVNLFDHVLADTETMFQFWAFMLSKVMPQHSPLICCLFQPIISLVMYALTLIWCVLLALPTFFTLLLLRTTKVETKSAAFGRRQAVILKESTCRKVLRWVAVLLRAIPMTGFLVVWPYVLVYWVLPSNTSQDLATGLLVLHTGLVLLLQVLGTVRAAASWAARQQDATAQLSSSTPGSQAETVAPIPTRPRGAFSVFAPANLIVLALLVVEYAQMMTLPLKAPPSGPASAPTNGSSAQGLPMYNNQSVVGLVPLWGQEIFNIAYANYSTDGQVEVAWVVLAVVGLLLLVFAQRLMSDLRQYGLQLFDGSTEAAKDVFFFSFVGAVVYGHGKPKHISTRLRQLIAIVCDALFMTMCLRLLSTTSCIELQGVRVWTQDTRIVCWEGQHQLLAFLSLAAYSYYVPLSIMIAPMLLEAPEDGKPKDVKYLKLYLMVITGVKCVMLIVSVYAGAGLVAANVTTLVANVFLSWCTLTWFFKSQQPIDSLTPSPLEPCCVGFINVWKAAAYSVGWLGITVLAIVIACYWRKGESIELAKWQGLVQEELTMDWRSIACRQGVWSAL